jgi:UDP-N-acetylglucosamine/UDP-N-acetylgalactosamine diphosphorylase
MTKEKLLSVLRPFGQEHLLGFWDQLAPVEQESLGRQIESIDFALVRRLFERRDQQADFRQLAARAQPPPAFRLGRAGFQPAKSDAGETPAAQPAPITPDEARRAGTEALRAGRVGAILVAGGQGTRLGVTQPKGMFPVGPVSQKTLFQIHIEKIIATGRRYGVPIPLYLMTSPATHEATVAFLAEHQRFGLPEGDLMLFRQGTMPAVDAQNGRVLLEEPGRIATSPDGHGGMVAALSRSGALMDIERRGIRHLSYFQVDNPLADVCGPEFVGYHVLAGAELSSQVVVKHDPLERLGVVVEIDHRLMVIEYSDLPEDIARQRNADGSLRHWAGSIAVHVIDAGLLRRMAAAADGLPFHLARKKAPWIDAAGRRIEPAEPNAIKFERFIFDLMPQARRAIVVEVDRAQAFAPLKNASGANADTPETVREQLLALHRGWLRQAGAELDDAAEVEISPLWALDAEEAAEKWPAVSSQWSGVRGPWLLS